MSRREYPGVRALGALLCLILLPGCASVLSATRDDDRSTLARLLRNGSSPDEGSSEGTTPLFVAIEAANLPATQLLVEAGADVNLPSRCRGRQVTPLQKAAIHGDLPLVRYLLSKGAGVRRSGSLDVFTLMALSKDPRDTAAITAAIIDSVKASGGDAAARELLDARSPSGWTPLAAAAWFNDVGLAEALLDQGASVEQLAPARLADSDSSDEWPALHFAVVAGNTAIADRLVHAGADPGQTSRDGHTSAQVLADLERRRAEWAEQERQRRRDEEEQRQQTFAMFQQGMQAVATGVQEGLDEARDTRERQQQALDDLNQAREAQALREQQEREEQERERRSREQASREQADSAGASSPGAGIASPGAAGVAAAITETAAATSAAGAPAAASDDGQERARKQEEGKRLAQEEARKKEEARRLAEEARKKEALDKREALEKAEEARKQEEARRKEQAEREGKEYRERLKHSIHLRADYCTGQKSYCIHGYWPAQIKKTATVHVSVRATCDRIIWTPPQFFHGPFVGGEYVTLNTKLNCPIGQVQVEVVEVR